MLCKSDNQKYYINYVKKNNSIYFFYSINKQILRFMNKILYIVIVVIILFIIMYSAYKKMGGNNKGGCIMANNKFKSQIDKILKRQMLNFS